MVQLLSVCAEDSLVVGGSAAEEAVVVWMSAVVGGSAVGGAVVVGGAAVVVGAVVSLVEVEGSGVNLVPPDVEVMLVVGCLQGGWRG